MSRILGFVRDMLMANVLGAGMIADAFFVAFKFPNFFRRLFAEGAFNAAFVPLFAGRLTSDGREVALRFAAEVAAVMWTGPAGFQYRGHHVDALADVRDCTRVCG